jgi:hypothetical protein
MKTVWTEVTLSKRDVARPAGGCTERLKCFSHGENNLSGYSAAKEIRILNESDDSQKNRDGA